MRRWGVALVCLLLAAACGDNTAGCPPGYMMVGNMCVLEMSDGGVECRPGTFDCNNDPADGCEVTASEMNCGGCGQVCSDGAVCVEQSECRVFQLDVVQQVNSLRQGRFGVNSIAVSESGKFAIAGFSFEQLDIGGTIATAERLNFVAMFEPSGVLEWLRELPTPNMPHTIVRALFDGDALVVAGALSADPLNLNDGSSPQLSSGGTFVVRYGADGSIDWVNVADADHAVALELELSNGRAVLAYREDAHWGLRSVNRAGAAGVANRVNQLPSEGFLLVIGLTSVPEGIYSTGAFVGTLDFGGESLTAENGAGFSALYASDFSLQSVSTVTSLNLSTLVNGALRDSMSLIDPDVTPEVIVTRRDGERAVWSTSVVDNGVAAEMVSMGEFIVIPSRVEGDFTTAEGLQTAAGVDTLLTVIRGSTGEVVWSTLITGSGTDEIDVSSTMPTPSAIGATASAAYFDVMSDSPSIEIAGETLALAEQTSLLLRLTTVAQ